MKYLFIRRGYFRLCRELFVIYRKDGFAPMKEAFHLLARTGDALLSRKYLYHRFVTLTLNTPQQIKPKGLPPLTEDLPHAFRSSSSQNTRLIAFHLPQYHPIPLNDQHWGKGFTEWRNVARGLPTYEDHYQPRHPGDLGYYDLRVPEVMEQQAALAKEYGISAFCYYLYWFKGKRLLNLPIDRMLQSKKPDFPFCFCWANENWTRKWDGLDKEVMIAQEHSAEDDLDFIRHLLPAFEDPRYLRINGKPVLLVYRTELLPNPLHTSERWREEVRKAGINDLYLIRCEGYDCFSNPRDLGFDASYEMPIFFLPDELLYDRPKRLKIHPDFKGKIVDYEKVVQYFCQREEIRYKRYKNVLLAWDNTARHGNNATIFHGVTPALYEEWLSTCIHQANQRFSGEERLVWINAWNEWAEGSYLEPDLVYGRSFLEATRCALEKTEKETSPNFYKETGRSH